MPILALSDVSKSFGALVVAERVTFALEKGEALGIVGPNGAGKSTLFNLITGNIRVDSGTVEFDGRDVTRAPPMARCLAGLGRTFQIPQPFDKLSVFENLLVAASFGSNRAEADVGERCALILEETGLIRRANQPAGTLGLLDRKRLELARALATEPKLLLLDEIAGGLTDEEGKELVSLIRRIRDSGVTIVWIEHVLHALLAVADRMMVLNFGEKIAEGPPARVIKDPEVQRVYMGIEA